MKSNTILFALVLAVTMLSHQSLANLTGCHVIVQAQSRHTSYQNDGLTNTPYDLNIVNIGTCNVSQVYLSISTSSATLVQSWNLLQLDSTHYWVEDSEGISPNVDFSDSGYIVGTSNLEGSVDASLATAICETGGDCANVGSEYSNGPFDCVNLTCNCDQVCIEDGGLPRCETVYETCVDQPTPCQATATIQARPQGVWMSNGVVNQIYDITVQNSGQCTLTAVQLQFTLSSGQSITQSWNLDGDNNLTNFGGQIAPSSSFAAVGIIVQGNGSVAVSVQNDDCESC